MAEFVVLDSALKVVVVIALSVVLNIGTLVYYIRTGRHDNER
jgi:hypothetical protein